MEIKQERDEAKKCFSITLVAGGFSLTLVVENRVLQRADYGPEEREMAALLCRHQDRDPTAEGLLMHVRAIECGQKVSINGG